MASLPQCPGCKQLIPLDDVNEGNDIAFCRGCGQVWKPDELEEAQAETSIDLTLPPRGIVFRRDARGFVLEISSRSRASLFLVPFSCVWSGGSLMGLYGSQIQEGRFDLLRSLFGLPFLAGSVFLWGLTLMTLFGKTEIRIENGRGTLFRGIGAVGFRQHFNWSAVTSIRRTRRVIEHRHKRHNRSPHRHIVHRITIEIEGGKPISFDGGQNDEQREFACAALRQHHRNQF